MSSSTSSDEEYFFCREIFLPGNFLPGNFYSGEFFASSQESSSSSSDSNMRLEYHVVVPWSYDTLHSLALTHLRVQTRAVAGFLGLITFLLHRLSTSLWRNSCKHWRCFSSERRMPPKPFFGDVTWGCGYLSQICSVLVRVKRRVLSGMSTFRISSMKNDRSTPLNFL